VSDKDVDSGDENLRISMRITEDNGWLPQSIFVLGETLDGQALFSGIIANGPATGGLVVFFLDIERSM
jgi:hypothetical protein